MPRTIPACVARSESVGDCDALALGRRRGLDRFRQPEVEYFHRAVGSYFDVGRFQIAMDDPPFMGRLERLGDLRGDRHDLVERHRPPGNAIGECRSFDQLHHQRAALTGFLEAVNLRDVRVVQRGEDLRFAAEPREPIRIGGDVRQQHLERHVAIQLAVAGAIDLAHSALAKFREDCIGPESLADHVFASLAAPRVPIGRESRTGREPGMSATGDAYCSVWVAVHTKKDARSENASDRMKASR